MRRIPAYRQPTPKLWGTFHQGVVIKETVIMGKTTIVDNCSATAVCGKAIAQDKIWDLLSGKFNIEDVIALLPGSQYVDEFNAHPFVCHRVLVFQSETPTSVELIAKSAHSFASFGNCDTVEMPKVPARESKKGHMVPDLDMTESVTPFKFKVVKVSKDAEGNDLVDAQVERVQWVKVVDFARFWFAEYGESGDVILGDDEMCRMKRVRKPVFERVEPSAKMVKAVEKFLSEDGASAE